jgi:hypothetical protein
VSPRCTFGGRHFCETITRATGRETADTGLFDRKACWKKTTIVLLLLLLIITLNLIFQKTV